MLMLLNILLGTWVTFGSQISEEVSKHYSIFSVDKQGKTQAFPVT